MDSRLIPSTSAGAMYVDARGVNIANAGKLRLGADGMGKNLWNLGNVNYNG
jgi:hypothetical protein